MNSWALTSPLCQERQRNDLGLRSGLCSLPEVQPVFLTPSQVGVDGKVRVVVV